NMGRRLPYKITRPELIVDGSFIGLEAMRGAHWVNHRSGSDEGGWLGQSSVVYTPAIQIHFCLSIKALYYSYL
ncbi:MAG: hypothetical protein V2I33_23780, partial [Kangiellaceae bacterium]|nr:hypothetical protein [Kangiellaceae bacterium]